MSSSSSSPPPHPPPEPVAVSKPALFHAVVGPADWAQFEDMENLYPNPNLAPASQTWGSSGNYDLVESLMKSGTGKMSGDLYGGGYGGGSGSQLQEVELMRTTTGVPGISMDQGRGGSTDATPIMTSVVRRQTSSTSNSLVEGYSCTMRSEATNCLTRSSSFPPQQQLQSNSSSSRAQSKALMAFKNNGAELPDEDRQLFIQQMKVNNGKSAMQQPKTNTNTRKRARTDQNSNPRTIETPPDVVHVRARRGQATDSHSLAERVRREKISQRMKVLQEIVPGCHKVLGKAMMLDEIINYVKSLQKQVEFLSMKLATANQVGIDSMMVNKECALVNENVVSFPSHGDVAYLNVPNELSSACQHLRPKVLMPSLIQ